MIPSDESFGTWRSLLLRGVSLCFVIGALPGGPARLAAQQMNETWTVTVASQTVPVSADGSFAISNVAAPDRFGPGGPGTPRDFRSDDFLRVVATGLIDGETWYAFNEPFQIVSGEIFEVGELTFTQTAPLTNHSISLTVDDPILTEIGQVTQLRATAMLSDMTTVDVTSRTTWTVYRTSNPDIVTVDQDGLITAGRRGPAFITAVNLGATSVASVIVSPGDPLTTVDGFVRREDGSPVAAAEVRIFDQFEQQAGGTTDINGHYEIPNVVTEFGLIHVKAQLIDGAVLLVGAITNLRPLPEGITDAGIITVSGPADDADADFMPDVLEPDLGLDPTDPDTDGDGIIDGREDLDGDGLINCEEVTLGTHPLEPDTDGDFLDDGAELTSGTKPLSVDTDRDGIIDGEEVEFGSDPLNRFGIPVDPLRTAGDFQPIAVSVENLAGPEPNVPAFETMVDPTSIENLAPPDPNLPSAEASGLLVSVENQPSASSRSISNEPN